MKRKICIVTGTRAEYGLLKPVISAVKNNSKLELQLIVTGMHLIPEFGNTIKEIKKGLEDLANKDRSEKLKKIIRTPDSINAKIKRLKAEGKIEGQKYESAVHRSLIQRRKDYERKPGEFM